MKKLVLSTVLLAMPLLVFPQDRSLGVALERYGVIAGAWFVNQKCRFLTETNAAEFSRDLAVVNTSLATTVANAGLVMSIQASGKKASETEPYSACSKPAEEVVNYAVAAVSQWSNEIRKTVLEAATRLPGAPK